MSAACAGRKAWSMRAPRYRKKEIGKEDLAQGGRRRHPRGGGAAGSRSGSSRSPTASSGGRITSSISTSRRSGATASASSRVSSIIATTRARRLPAERMVVKAKATWSGPIFAEHFSFLKSVTKETREDHGAIAADPAFPGRQRCRVAWRLHHARPVLERPDRGVLRRNWPRCTARAARYLQIDETSLVKFGDPEIRAVLEERGDDWQKLAGVLCGSAERHPRQRSRRA